MKHFFGFLILALLIAAKGHTQDKQHRKFANTDLQSNIPHRTTSSGYSGTGANIDVVYHRTNWTVNPATGLNSIAGTVVTHFKTVQPNVSTISFDFNQGSFDNAALQVLYHGIACVTAFEGNVLRISLPITLSNSGTIDSVLIQYAGNPATAGLSGGFPVLSYTDQSGILQYYIASLSESYEDRDWWPCKADMQDKIDSMDINVTVPWTGNDTFWVASNGLLVDSAMNGTQRTYSYRTRYPIASYLVCLAAAKYRRFYSSVTVGTTTVPVYWYLLAGKPSSYYSSAVAAMTQMNRVVQAFGEKLGEYPFKEEKHGYYDGLDGAGGMEHQTFSAISSNSVSNVRVLDHELMHQWFGDHVTFATWNDLWLAEGFATFGEVLAPELVPSLGYSAYGRRNAIKSQAIGYLNTSAWIPNANIASSATIWNSSYGNTVYVRGGMIVLMLRAMCGDDRFFRALKIYQTRFGGKAASADSLKQVFNEVTGVDLTEFFNDYAGGSGSATAAVGGRGNPINSIKWNSPVANRLLLGVNAQSKTTNANVAYFNGPVVVRAVGASKDTSITFFDWGSGNLSYAGNGISVPVSSNVLGYDLSFTPTALVYDDSAWTMSTGSTVLDTALKGYVWYGAVDSNWFNPANWAACCGVPPANADVTIATVAFPPVLSAAVSVRNLRINPLKNISIATGTLTISGAITGTGAIKGSAVARLELTGKAGTLKLMQGNAEERTLQALVMQPGSSATLATDALIKACSIHPAASLTVPAGINLVTQ